MGGEDTSHRPAPCHPTPVTFSTLVALGAIRFYQACLSPALPSTCRFYPSCSAYAFEAVEKWGVWKGGRLALRRLLRCRPWGSYGYDPVPERQVAGNRF
ncbi:MAG: membrane protein insertion efficiency factor YidD [Terriglobia bacterium]